ncbi:hypothetical protein FHR24_003075 [Wenyingzhuangia heitensis]|uniref:Uncharacterized protein n=1 Tax=Wenyingzhuangia heitensis TaxID=1487859 RepID=A0ABX0UFD1_9FLAO|nr:hypothetical protein [Wenyingzhuangia heitensis]NIJ46585.1 hypothetical protein [Wenyingzhuangia heitensis]
MENNCQLNLQEVLVKEFNFTKIDIDRYQHVIDNPKISPQLMKLVFAIRSNPRNYQSELHKKNTLLKACKNCNRNNYRPKSTSNRSYPQSIGSLIKKIF